ncbi:MAG: glycosyltransferase [Bacteroides sp.]|nr:glycosyltransferase [Bacteroides sp.]
MSVYRSDNPTFFDRAIQSIWTDQSMPPNDVILVEDGPLPEALQDVVKKWERIIGDKLIILKNEQNIGLTKSLNKGIAKATCEYIARMDSDDISMPERFKLQSDFLDKHSDITVVGGSLQEFDSKNENLNVRHYPLTPKEVESFIHRGSPLAHPTVMIRKKLFDDGILYDERYRTSQDIALWFDVLCAGYKIANLDQVTIKFRRDGEVYKRRSKEKAKNEFKIYMNGIKRLNGLFTFKYIYPTLRYLFRLMPVAFVKRIYGSKLRAYVLRTKSSSN